MRLNRREKAIGKKKEEEKEKDRRNSIYLEGAIKYNILV